MKRFAFATFLTTSLLPHAARADDGGGSAALGFFLIALLIGAYFIPTMVAVNRKHLSTGAICMFNLFLGWTFLGWVLALVWAMTSNTKENAERYSRPVGP